ncbi:MAG: hypothetical protein B7733_05730 [Myxococcales bacterium FL481]|nr:MAG: hypothetical protein B7733_05730 [Myxococcales bacterium FL481]
MSAASKRGRSSRRRGHDFEREIARKYRSAGFEARRGIQSRDGDEAADVEGTPWWVETKYSSVRHPNPVAAFRQATEATDGRPPIVWTKLAGGDTLVTMSDEEFWRLIGETE